MKINTPKVYLLTIGGAIGVIAILVGLKATQIVTLMGPPPTFPPTTVTSAEVKEIDWRESLEAIGTITPVQGVLVRAELGGSVEEIAFESGASVEQGALLVQLNVDSEDAQLRVAEARAELARREIDRARELVGRNSASKAELDTAEANFKAAEAEVDAIRATIAKKTIRAPFAGRLGIRQINKGQVLEPGAAVVGLQNLETVYVDFNLPQQQVAALRVGLPVKTTTDAALDRTFEGTISALDSNLDARSRNLRVQATLPNPDELLKPGMFARVEILLDGNHKALAIPATAVLYSPFGDSVFKINEQAADQTKPAGLVLSQKNIRIVSSRGDFLAVTGLAAGEQVVSSGVFKLSNGMPVVIDNKLAPNAELTPEPGDS